MDDDASCVQKFNLCNENERKYNFKHIQNTFLNILEWYVFIFDDCTLDGEMCFFPF